MKCGEIAVAVLFVVVLAGPAGAAVINGRNWADTVDAYSGNIQNYGGTPMDATTVWWVTGVSDADFGGDSDYVAGWRVNADDEYIIVKFDIGLADITGDDLVIHVYGGSSASASVLVSTNGTDFSEIGTIGAGTPGDFRDEAFDFAGQFGGDVHYVKVLRTADGSKTGMFFDSFASVPEPATMVLLICSGTGFLLRRRNQKPASPRDESVGK
jgi:hypothetical protein